MALSDPPRVLVAGLNGRLRPVVSRLLERGHRPKVLTRNPDSESAARLAARGAELVAGDFDDRPSLDSAFRGAEIVVVAGTAHQAGPHGEARHGINAAEAAAAAGVPHLIYVSGAGAEQATGVPVFDSKHAVEERIRALGLVHTIVAPVYFMENAFNPWNVPALRAHRFPLPLAADRPLRQVAIADVGSFVAHVIEHAEEFAGRRVPIASDELTGSEAAEALSRVTGARFEFAPVRLDDLNPPMRRLFEWLDQVGETADVAGLRDRYPEVGWHSFYEWAATLDWP